MPRLQVDYFVKSENHQPPSSNCVKTSAYFLLTVGVGVLGLCAQAVLLTGLPVLPKNAPTGSCCQQEIGGGYVIIKFS